MTARNPVSVVVANNRACIADVEATWQSLRTELIADDEVVWVDQAGLGPPVPSDPRVVAIDAPVGAGRGRCNALGLAAASHSLVAFTDSSTTVEPGWADAAIAGLRHTSVVGGPVLPGNGKRVRDWAGFFIDYAAHAVPPYLSASRDVSGNNVAYRRHCLPERPRELWKDRTDRQLSRLGERPCALPLMSVRSHRRYSWWDLTAGQVLAGAFYGADRAASWSRLRRVCAAAGCIVLPFLACARTWLRVRQADDLRPHWATALPLVLLARSAWALGEAKGYLTNQGDARRVW